MICLQMGKETVYTVKAVFAFLTKTAPVAEGILRITANVIRYVFHVTRPLAKNTSDDMIWMNIAEMPE